MTMKMQGHMYTVYADGARPSSKSRDMPGFQMHKLPACAYCIHAVWYNSRQSDRVWEYGERGSVEFAFPADQT